MTNWQHESAESHPSGTPALRIPSAWRWRCLRKTGLSLSKRPRKRRIVNVGSSASPAWTSALASSCLSKLARAAANQKWVSGKSRLSPMARRNQATASSSAPRYSFALPEKCIHAHALLSRGESRSASCSSPSVSSARPANIFAKPIKPRELGQVRIKCQRSLVFGDALGDALRLN